MLLLLLFSLAFAISAKQWHLHNSFAPQHDINVQPVWDEGVFGQNVTVCIIDDGVDFNHPSLTDAARLDLSFDYNENSKSALPRSEKDRHGTRCAGQIAARNGPCGSGVAPKAGISAIRLLGSKISPSIEAAAVTFRNDANHIYSCSWGPADDGKTVEGPDAQVLNAFISGLLHGRSGLGSLFVFAAGNGRFGIDNCNFDGYANAPFSITIGAISAADKTPYYMEECSAMLAVTYSSGRPGTDPKITTTDLHSSCTDTHGGTSAAAPLAAGALALALSVRPDLSWRDWQHLLVESAQPVASDDPSWIENGIGRRYSPLFGFGKIDAHILVTMARNWTAVNPPIIRSLPWIRVHKAIPGTPSALVESHLHLGYPIHWEYFELAQLKRLEHVTVSVNVRHGRRGNLVFRLCSPSRTCVPLTSRRPLDDDNKAGLAGWTFGTVAFWGETAVLGTWTLQILNVPEAHAQHLYTGQFISWRLTLWGESESAEFDSDRYALDFVNNYYPPTVDYFQDVDGVLRRGETDTEAMAGSYRNRQAKKHSLGFFFLLAVIISAISLTLMYIIK